MSSPLIRTRPTAAFLAAITLLFPLAAHAAEHITLTNGFEINSVRRETLPDSGPDSGKVRLYPVGPSNANPEALSSYIDVAASAIALHRAAPRPTPRHPPAGNTPRQNLRRIRHP